MNRIGRQAALALLATTLLASLLASPVAAAEPSFTAGVVQSGLTVPWDIAFVPDGRMIVTERPGRVRVYADGNRNAALLRTTTIASVRAEGEAGLMGVAVDPDFSTRPYLYLCASRQVDGTWRNQVLRYRLLGDSTLRFDGYVIRWNMIAASIHNGCAVEIGPDSMVYVSMGDAAQPGLAQDSASNNGKILRATRQGGIPADNPVFPGQTKPSYVW
nr:PQQ-dependent sugar dehydrogenase [Chloroflexota bacterium]